MHRALSAFLAALAGALALLAACELLLRMLPVSTSTAVEYRIDPLIATYPPHYRFRHSFGWDLRNAQTTVTNNFGFAADRDFVPDPNAIALVGDSYIEAAMLPSGQRPGVQLQALLGAARPVYALGAPGSSLLDFAERIRWASQTLAVRDMVVLVTPTDVLQSLCGSGNVQGPCLRPDTLAPDRHREPSPSSLKIVLRESALAQYLLSQLKLSPTQWPEALKAWAGGAFAGPKAPEAVAPPADPRAAAAAVEVAADTVSRVFFERIRPHVRGRLVLLVGEVPSKEGHHVRQPQMARFIEVARAEHATVVELVHAYREHVTRSPLSLHVSPRDRHLNAVGVRIMAEAAAAALRSAPPWPGREAK